MSAEVWKPIPGFKGYEVSSHGRVRSFKKRVSCPGSIGAEWGIADEPQRILSQAIDPTNGYKFVGLCVDGVLNILKVHALVLLAFCGEPPNGMEGCHNDSNPLNNHITNLRYDTHEGNMQDRHKLSCVRAYEMREKYAGGETIEGLMENYGLSESYIMQILRGSRFPEAGGPTIPGGKLSAEEVEAIRKRRAAGEFLQSIADDYGYDESAISLICSGKRHKDVGGPITNGRADQWEARQ